MNEILSKFRACLIDVFKQYWDKVKDKFKVMVGFNKKILDPLEPIEGYSINSPSSEEASTPHLDCKIDQCDMSNYPIAEAIINLKFKYGIDFVKSSAIVNALNDYNAFDKNKSLRSIFKVLIKEGIYSELSEASVTKKNEDTISHFTYRIISLYGFKQELVLGLIEEILLGFGKISKTELLNNYNNKLICHHTPIFQNADNKKSKYPKVEHGTEKYDKDLNCPSGSHIVFLGKELGCSEIEMVNHIRSKGFNHIGFSYDGTRAEFSGSFLGCPNSVVAIWKTQKAKIVWKIEIRIKSPINIIKEIYGKKYIVEKLDFSETKFLCKLLSGTIYVRQISKNSTIIEYEDRETLKIRQFERKEEKLLKEQLAQHETNRIINRANLDDI